MQLGITKIKEYLKVKDKQRVSFFEQYMEDNQKKQDEVLDFVNNSKNKEIYQNFLRIGQKNRDFNRNPWSKNTVYSKDNYHNYIKKYPSINFKERVDRNGQFKELKNEEKKMISDFLLKIGFQERILWRLRKRMEKRKSIIIQNNTDYDVDTFSNGISSKKLNISSSKLVKRDSSHYFSSSRFKSNGLEKSVSSSKKSQFVKGRQDPQDSGSSPKNQEEIKNAFKNFGLRTKNREVQETHRDLLPSPDSKKGDLPTSNNLDATDSKFSLKKLAAGKFGKKLKIFNKKASNKSKIKLILLEESQKDILKKSKGLIFKSSWSDYFKFLIPSIFYDYSKGRVFKKVNKFFEPHPFTPP